MKDQQGGSDPGSSWRLSVCLELCQVGSASFTEVISVTYSDLLKKGNPVADEC